MIRRSSKLPSYPTQAEVRALFAAISNLRDRTLFGLAYAYGLRVGEIVWGIGRSSRP
jgi:integrase